MSRGYIKDLLSVHMAPQQHWEFILCVYMLDVAMQKLPINNHVARGFCALGLAFQWPCPVDCRRIL